MDVRWCLPTRVKKTITARNSHLAWLDKEADADDGARSSCSRDTKVLKTRFSQFKLIKREEIDGHISGTNL